MSMATALLIVLASLVALLAITYIVMRSRLRAELAAGSQIVQTACGPVEYVDVGKGPVVLHAHGMLGGADHLRYCEFLVKGGFRVIVPSRPGYLRTPIAIGKTPKEQAAIYAALLDTLGIEQVALYAISQGGAASLEFTLAYPERCWSLVLVSAFTRQLQTNEFTQVLPYVRAFMSLDFVLWLLEPVMLPVIMRQARKALSSSDQQDAKKMAGIKGFFSTAFQASLRGRGLVNDFNNTFHWAGIPLDQLRVPALVIHGTQDAMVNYEDSVATAKQIPSAKFLPLQGAGHEAFITCVDQIESETLGLLRAHLPGNQRAG